MKTTITIVTIIMTIIINEERNYRELKEMSNSQKSVTEKINLIKEGNEIGTDEVIKCNEIINNSLKSQI